MSGPAKICPTCSTGFILPTDLHMMCEGCLGQEHAIQALTADASCPSCRRLPVEEKQRWVALFADQDKGFKLTPFPFDQLVNFELESDDPASEEEGDGSSLAPPIQMEGLESSSRGEAGSGDLALPRSTSTPLPAIGALVNTLPDIIQRAADAKGLVVPEVQAPPLDELTGQFASPVAAYQFGRFPVVQSYMAGAAS